MMICNAMVPEDDLVGDPDDPTHRIQNGAWLATLDLLIFGKFRKHVIDRRITETIRRGGAAKGSDGGERQEDYGRENEETIDLSLLSLPHLRVLNFPVLRSCNCFR